MLREGSREVAGGILLLALSGAYLYGAFQYRLGTALRMGAGYFPMLVGMMAVLMAILITLRGIALIRAGGAANAETGERLALRPLLAVAFSIIVFAVSIRWFGFLAAIAASTIVAAAGDRRSTVKGTLILAAALCFGSWAIFVLLLGLQVPVLGSG